MNIRLFRSVLKGTLLVLLLSLSVPDGLAQDAPKPIEPANKPAQQTGQTAPTTTNPPAQNSGQSSAQPPPSAPAGPKPGAITLSGLLDFYYGVNFRNPGNPNPRSPFYPSYTNVPLSGGGFIHVDNALRFNDINNRKLTFSLGELDAVRTEDRRLPLGFHVTLTVGEEPLIFHATEPGNPYAWETFHNLYVYHTFDIARRGVEVDAGIWASPFGIEVLESPQDDNYSRSIMFVLSPFYHAGVRAKSALNSTTSLEVAVVTGWNDIVNDNGILDQYLQLIYKPNARFTQVFSIIDGTDATGPYGPIIAPKNQARIHTVDVDINSIYQVTPRFKVAGWVNFGNGAGPDQGHHVSGAWLGEAAFARYQITPRIAVAARVEQYEDHPGVGGVGLRFGNPFYTKYREATLTLEYAMFGGRLLHRLEYRHDHANMPLFGYGKDGSGPDQDTFYLGEVYKF